MARISIRVGDGDGDFTLFRDGQPFTLREGERVVLLDDMVFLGAGDASEGTTYIICRSDIEKASNKAA